MNEIYKSFLRGFNDSAVDFKNTTLEEMEEELYISGINLLEDSSKDPINYSKEQIVKLGYVENLLALEVEQGNFIAASHGYDESSAYYKGWDVGDFDHRIRKARELFGEDFFKGAKSTCFPELYEVGNE